MMLPLFTPCQVTEERKLKAFIAPVNHNNLSENMVIDIANTMMGDYCGSSNSHMQEFGDDAGVIVGRDDGDDVSYFEQFDTNFSNVKYYNLYITLYCNEQTE